MLSNMELLSKISKIAVEDGRYSREGFLFILASLEHCVTKSGQHKHLTGQELSFGIAEYARGQFGYLAKTVLTNWGISKTRDYGEIVYLLISKNLMSKTESDRVEDFENVYNFKDEFSWSKTKPEKFPERF
jgi:uncharacterized repeat protein (TIGR04138 family)